MPPRPRSLRIALISEHASPLALPGSVDAGGQNIYVQNVARKLALQGHQVDVLTRLDRPNLPPCVQMQPGVRVLHLPAGPARFVPKEALLEHMPVFARAAAELLRRAPPVDVVHANFFMSGQVGLWLKRQYGLPLVVTFHALGLVRREHQGAADGFPPERVGIERRLVREADCVIAECPQDRADLERLYGARHDALAMVPCGVDMEEFRPADRRAARHALGWPEEGFVVLQLGRLVPRKGIDNVIRAMAQLPRDIPATLMVVGGDAERPEACTAPEMARLDAIARSLGVADRVRFIGRRNGSQLRDCYAAADVFVTTPAYEPFGITPLEAMACGTPVIGSAVGGIQYSVADGVTGYLVPPNDPQALAARLAELHAQPLLAQQMGRAGIGRVRARFTWDRVADDLTDVYRAVCAANAPLDDGALAQRAAMQTAAPAWLEAAGR